MYNKYFASFENGVVTSGTGTGRTLTNGDKTNGNISRNFLKKSQFLIRLVRSGSFKSKEAMHIGTLIDITVKTTQICAQKQKSIKYLLIQ